MRNRDRRSMGGSSRRDMRGNREKRDRRYRRAGTGTGGTRGGRRNREEEQESVQWWQKDGFISLDKLEHALSPI